MTEPTADYVAGTDIYGEWRRDVLTGRGPELYPAGKGALANVEIGKGLITLIGGAPGQGKTALTMQLVVDALRLSDDLRVVVCNVEMSPQILLDRQLARLSGVDLSTIRYRQLGQEHTERIDRALDTLAPLAERLCFVQHPFTLNNALATLQEFEATILLVDYVQRIQHPGEHRDKRYAINAVMAHLRRFADAGVAVLLVSAVSRTKDSKGRSGYDSKGLNAASFRESSELEFGADTCYILVPYEKQVDGAVTMRCVKSRFHEPRDLGLEFDRCLQRFTPLTDSLNDSQGSQECDSTDVTHSQLPQADRKKKN